MNTYTIWIAQEDRRGTMFVTSQKGRTPQSAANKALRECSAEWGAGYPVSALTVVGIAKGDVELIEWND